jgi:vanillate O-demethylase ferredoxin subunit
MNDRMELRVRRVIDEADGIRSFELVRPDGGPLVSFEAGAHIDVYLPNGAVRQYSLLNDDADRDRYVIAVLRVADGRGGSAFMHDAVEAGSRIAVGEPRNAFALADVDAPAVLVAGGIGVTPLLAMARRLSRDGRPFAMHFATRSLARTPFRDELKHAAFEQQVNLYLDDGPPYQRFDAARLTQGIPAGAHVYLCGPTGFMKAVSASVGERHDVTLHTEYFAAPVAPEPKAASFDLVLARSKVETTVPADRSIVEVLREHGVEPPLNCEQGICGTCRTTVLGGDIEHRDYCLSPGERACGDRMMICVSRGKPGTTLTLDL